MKIKSMATGQKFFYGGVGFVKIPHMNIQGMSANFIINVLKEGLVTQPFQSPEHTVDYMSEELDIPEYDLR